MYDDNNSNASYLEARDSLTGLEGHSLVTLMSCPSQVSSSNQDGEDKLRMDLEIIELHYQDAIKEISKKRNEAIMETRKKRSQKNMESI